MAKYLPAHHLEPLPQGTPLTQAPACENLSAPPLSLCVKFTSFIL